jgi:CRISPR/Cas system Type II protein with McrA/HNH and RuvC-like nuclease domain
MKERILLLRLEGKTYNEIKSILGCSKSTIAYHCSSEQKIKSINRSKKIKSSLKGNVSRRLYGFLSRKSVYFRHSVKYSERKIVSHKFTVKDILNIIGKDPKCYLTGKKIDLMNFGSYQFDHIKPVGKGGDNSLGNFGLTLTEANMAKHDMTVDEFVQLCKDVLINFGYKISP